MAKNKLTGKAEKAVEEDAQVEEAKREAFENELHLEEM